MDAFIQNLFGLNTDDATATAAQILSGYIAYARGQKLIGTLSPLNSSIDKICSFGWGSYPMVNWSSDYKVGNGILVSNSSRLCHLQDPSV